MVLSPAGFADEATLQTLVKEAPQLLPLSGDPTVVMVGREVPCGPGYAGLIGIETSGRVVIIEVKLATNSEARRAVVAQFLSYASYLQGVTVQQLDRILAAQLSRRGLRSVVDAVQVGVTGPVDEVSALTHATETIHWAVPRR